MLSIIQGQLSKHSGHYSFNVSSIEHEGEIPFITSAFLNGIRRDLAQQLDDLPANMILLDDGIESKVAAPSELTYKANIANSIDRALYSSRGAKEMEESYEQSHRPGVELMRSKYCVRYELGLCPKLKPGIKPEPLYLLNSGRRLRLDFHCKECEMTVTDA